MTRYISGGKNYKGIPNTAYRVDSGIVINTEKPNYIKDLDIYPSPYLTGEYDYLLKIPIVSFTKELMEELEKQRDIKLEEKSKLESTNIKDIWKNDLKKLRVVNKKYNDELFKEYSETENKKVSKRKRRKKSAKRMSERKK